MRDGGRECCDSGHRAGELYADGGKEELSREDILPHHRLPGELTACEFEEFPGIGVEDVGVLPGGSCRRDVQVKGPSAGGKEDPQDRLHRIGDPCDPEIENTADDDDVESAGHALFLDITEEEFGSGVLSPGEADQSGIDVCAAVVGFNAFFDEKPVKVTLAAAEVEDVPVPEGAGEVEECLKTRPLTG